MVVGSALEAASFAELKHILAWLADANAAPARDPGVVVGGWAVYAYNPYYGSIDIDIVISSNMCKSLSHWLMTERNFETWHTDEVGWQGVRKKGPGDHWIIADFGSRHEHYSFESRQDRLDFSEVDNHTTTRKIHDFEVLVPERALLILFKLKAAWDRGERLRAGTSTNRAWDQGKRVKDLADVLALLDPSAGGTDLSIGYLGEKFVKYPFLVDILRECGQHPPSIERYGRLSTRDARQAVSNIIDLTT